MGRACSTNGEKGNEYRISVEKPDGKRPKRRCVDNIKMYLREIGWDGRDWIDLAQDRDQWRALANTIMNVRVPLNAGKFLSSCRIGGSSRRAQLHECVSIAYYIGFSRCDQTLNYLILDPGFDSCAVTNVNTETERQRNKCVNKSPENVMKTKTSGYIKLSG
jgi:hypothetical protein